MKITCQAERPLPPHRCNGRGHDIRVLCQVAILEAHDTVGRRLFRCSIHGTSCSRARHGGRSSPALLGSLAWQTFYSGSRCSSHRHQDCFRFDGPGLEILMQHEYITRSLLVGSASITEWSIRRCLC